MPVRMARMNDLGNLFRTDHVISHRVLRIATNKRGVRMALLFQEATPVNPGAYPKERRPSKRNHKVISQRLWTQISQMNADDRLWER